MWPSNNIVCKITCTNTNYYFTKNLSVTVSQRHLSEEIFYDSLGIGIQIRGEPSPRLLLGPRIWLPKFEVDRVQRKDPNPLTF